jgi:hypothetical protein
MADRDQIEAALSIQSAARIAEQILAKAEDGAKLFTIHKHYPSGGKAIEVGFYFGIGMIFAVCFSVLVGKLVSLGIAAL